MVCAARLQDEFRETSSKFRTIAGADRSDTHRVRKDLRT
jgi:hypothetical protein